MLYHSSRNRDLKANSREAIVKGLASDGGLFVSHDALTTSLMDPALLTETYQETAQRVFGHFLNDFTPEEIAKAVNSAYDVKFADARIAPLSRVGHEYLLELYHGPTSAFKDMALSILPWFMSFALESMGKKVMIVTATSGDTGKAALEAFQDVPNVGIAVLYPHRKVSEIQRLQMATQRGDNVAVFAIEGNFDDAQTAAKTLFNEADRITLPEGVDFSSANSINIGRLIPQVVYYFQAYKQLLEEKALAYGEAFDVCVPTGNFGNILAGYYARACGLPIRRMIVASNQNHVLTDFLATGTYDRRRDFHKTITPSMDILISSNLERLLYEMSGGDCELIASLMKQLKEEGHYQVSPELLAKIQSVFEGAWADDEKTAACIREAWEKDHRLIDPHTAVALAVAREKAQDDVPCVVLSTASPYKFAYDVLAALGAEVPADPFEAMALLERLTGTTAPKNLSELKRLPVRFDGSIAVNDVPTAVVDAANRIFKA